MAVDANAYFQINPDVARAYEENTYGLSPQDFAETHWLMYGQNEQRDAPETIDPYFQSNPDVANAFTDNRYDMGPDDFAQAHYLLYGQDEQRSAPDALDPYFVNNPDVADAYQENRYGLSPSDFASVHYDKYGQAEQRDAPTAYDPYALQNFLKTPQGMVPPARPVDRATEPAVSRNDLSARLSQTRTTPYMRSLGTIPVNDDMTLGAGNVPYASSLVQALRGASAGPASSNAGVTQFQTV